MRKENNKGITLIALIITIIVMLILVAVSVTVALNGGLFKTAKEAAEGTKVEGEKERLLSIALGALNNKGMVELGELEKALEGTEFEYNNEDKTITSKNTQKIYKVSELLGDVSGGEDAETTPISTETSYVGAYADINDDGTPDGIIYADLAHTVSGKWNNDNCGDYAYTEESGLKSYYIKDENYTGGDFNDNDDNNKTAMIAPVKGTTGKDRFYVMALEDITIEVEQDDNTKETIEEFYWYASAQSHVWSDRHVEESYNDFGEGKSNTIAMLNDWNNNTEKYGEQNERDMWGVIQNNEIKQKYPLIESENDSGKWFVPSKAEWAAFGDYLYTKLGVTIDDFDDFEERGLNFYYWSSSPYSNSVWGPHFISGIMDNWDTDIRDELWCRYVRLSSTF